MQNSWKGKAIVTLAILVVIGGMIFHFFDRSPEQPASSPPEILQKPIPASSQNFFSRSQRAATVRDAASELNDGAANPLAIPREKIEEYLTLHKRNAASLLAAYHASGDADNPVGDINYLKEAATNYPNDPHVQWTVLAQWTALETSGFPEDQRKWLDAFKESSPSNSLANYLSARDYFKNNQSDAAIKELLKASGKAQFTDYTMESYLGAEELFRFSGESPLMTEVAGMAAASDDLLPGLDDFKGIVTSIRDVQKQYPNSGNPALVENLTRMGLGLADRLISGDGGRFVISQLVGIAVENIALQSLDQNTSYDFLDDKTPAERLQELKQKRAALVELSKSYTAIFPTLTESEWINYHERMKIYGEAKAMRWLQQQHPASSPQGGQ